jgi:Flp pilus assembly protein TadG
MTKLLRSQAGQALVEFSLAVIVLMVLVIGVVEAGRAVWNYNTLSNAVREGSRYAIVHGGAAADPAGPIPNNAQVELQVEQFASGLDTGDLTVTSTWLDGNNNKGSRVRVSATYDFDTIFSSLLGIPAVTMTSTSTLNITN